MAKSRVALGVELNGDQARLALVENSEQGLRILSFQTVKGDEEMARTFRSFSRRPSDVVCAVPLHQGGIRTLTLPPTTDENLERVVGLEAEGALPLQAEDLAFAHHVLGMTDQSRLEVLLAAARQSSVQEAMQRVNCVPWVSGSCTLSAVALFNTLQHVRETGREPVCAVLNVEETGSELLLLDRTKIVVAQAIPIGCGSVVAAPAPTPVAAGGERSALSTLSNSPLPWIPGLSQQVRYALQAVSYERGITIERLYLCGAGAGSEGVEWQLSERLDVPVSLLAPESGDPRVAAAYTVAYGCALQAAGVAVMPLRLTLARVTVAREVEQRRQVRVSWGALVGSVVLAGTLVVAALFHRQSQELEHVQAQQRALGIEVPTPVMAPEELKTTLGSIEETLATRVSAAKAIATLSRQLPQGTWLTELNYNAASGCTIRGYSVDAGGAQRALVGLLRQQLFDEVTLDFQTEDEIAKVPAWGFQISCKLRPKEKTTRRGTKR
ncbi:MAG: Type pilus assembly protein PilM [Armatimonadetes bacterium]|nr:Type pilus assembly protein PilM [Armatimonadota bacterium]